MIIVCVYMCNHVGVYIYVGAHYLNKHEQTVSPRWHDVSESSTVLYILYSTPTVYAKLFLVLWSLGKMIE